jgi:hypothetical protein
MLTHSSSWAKTNAHTAILSSTASSMQWQSNGGTSYSHMVALGDSSAKPFSHAGIRINGAARCRA